MGDKEVAIIGWHEGLAGQIHSWFEESGLGKIVYFIQPENQLPEIRKVKRYVSQFNYPENGKFKGVPLICEENWPDFLFKKGISKALVTLPDTHSRWKEIEKGKEYQIELINAIHPTSLLLKDCKLGNNVIIHPRAIIGYRTEIDDGVIVNTGTQIDHHCRIMKSVTFDPGVVLAGNVLVEEFCTIHTGATIINRMTIGSDSIIGAGAVIIRDVKPKSKMVGVPAKDISQRKK